MAKFGNDDGYAIGPAGILFPAIAKFAADIREKHLLQLQVRKTEVFSWSGLLPPEAPGDMKVAGTSVEGIFYPGMIVYGIPVGCDQYVKQMLNEVVDDIASEISRVQEVLTGESQAMWAVLNSSLAHKLDWHLTLCYPSDVREAAERLDRIFWSVLGFVSRSKIPTGRDQGASTLSVPDVDWLNGSTFQELLVPQPIKLGGLGVRSLTETSPAAFIGGVEMSLPHFTGEAGLCPELQNVLGLIEGGERWSAFVDGGSRTSTEFSNSWTSLTTEAAQYAAYLDIALEFPLADGVESAGGSSVDGSTRRKLVHQRESLRHQALGKALKEHPDRSFRPATVYQNFDKLSGAWLLALPGPSTGLSSQVFAEAMAAHLCLPSPAVQESGWVGKPLGRRGENIDQFGDTIMNCSELPGDSWRHRHDTGKMAITTECYDAKLPVDCEVYGLFSDLLPAAAEAMGGDLEWGRGKGQARVNTGL